MFLKDYGKRYRYLFRLLIELEGIGAWAALAASVVLRVLQPLLAMALPSAIVALLTGSRSPSATLAAAAAYILLLQASSFCLAVLYKSARSHAFLFRLDSGIKIYRKVLWMEPEQLESSSCQKKLFDALQGIYSGNERGTEKYLLALTDCLVNLAGLAVYSVIVGRLHPRLLLFLLLITAAAAFCHVQAGIRAKAYEDPLSDLFTDFSYLKEKTGQAESGKDIRLYRMNRWFSQTFDSLLQHFTDLLTREKSCYSKASCAEAFLSLLRDGIVYGYLILQLKNGAISVSIFLLCIGAVSGFGSWMNRLFQAVQDIRMNHHYVCQYQDFLEWETGSQVSAASPAHPGRPHELRMDHVSYRYEGQEADVIHDLSLTIHPGEKVALVGRNGAGKTTLVKLLCGIYRPTEGAVYLDGQDLSTLAPEARAREFAAVFQDIFTLSFSLQDNVSCASPRETDLRRTEDCLKQAGLWEKVQSLPRGLQTTLNRDLDEAGITLSGGETQRLMLARALYKDAPVIFLDEPTAALDPLAESELYQKYDELTREKTSVFISHRLSSTQFCDRVLYMENGRITEEGTHASLMQAQGAYAELFALQARYYQDHPEEVECYA